MKAIRSAFTLTFVFLRGTGGTRGTSHDGRGFQRFRAVLSMRNPRNPNPIGG